MDSPITGTATFDVVEVSPIPYENTVEVTGFYHGEPTTYSSPKVVIESLVVEPEGEGDVTLSAEGENEWVWVVAEEERLTIHGEKPEAAK